MEIPWMTLFNREEREMRGVQLSEAKKEAPQLDSCPPLVNQASVPDLSSNTSPSEEVLSQICILEFELRFGGHLNSLTGVHDQLVRQIRVPNKRRRAIGSNTVFS